MITQHFVCPLSARPTAYDQEMAGIVEVFEKFVTDIAVIVSMSTQIPVT